MPIATSNPNLTIELRCVPWDWTKTTYPLEFEVVQILKARDAQQLVQMTIWSRSSTMGLARDKAHTSQRKTDGIVNKPHATTLT